MEDNFAKEINDIMNGDKHLSYSQLSKFLKSPRHYKLYKTEKKDTKAMLEGRLFHMACLEPEKFKEKYFKLNDSEKVAELVANGSKNPRITNDYKAWRDEQIAKNAGKEMIGADDFDKYMMMRNCLMSNSFTSKLMNNLISTEESFCIDYSGYKIKGQIDGKGVHENKRFTIDLKKVSDAEFKRVKWNIHDMNLDLQAAIYRESSPYEDYYLIFVDNSGHITTVRLSDDTIIKGHEKLDFALDKFEECAELDAWNASYEFYNNGFINY